jgi:hypothetical protein
MAARPLPPTREEMSSKGNPIKSASAQVLPDCRYSGPPAGTVLTPEYAAITQ